MSRLQTISDSRISKMKPKINIHLNGYGSKEGDINYNPYEDDYSSSPSDDSDYDEYDEHDWEYDEDTGQKCSVQPNKQSSSNANNKPHLKNFASRVIVEEYNGPQLKSNVTNLLSEKARTIDNDRNRIKDKSDRATSEQVLDDRVRTILYKMISTHVISKINGCVSTGKEANVYHALSPEKVEYAVKIYKTSILIFKDRSQYVVGERRYRHGYCKSNPRKMVALWAEKEMRNLNRLVKAGICAPTPIKIKGTVLVMTFFGKNGCASPKLKDAILEASKPRELYRECIVIMWKMYNQCKLVHADLSEYNILYHKGSLVIIDVSQSVEQDHPKALEFLRKDCTNITDFFKKNQVAVMSIKSLFEFIVDPNITEKNMDEYLDEMSAQIDCNTDTTSDPEQQIEDEVFKNVYIPQRLDEVIDIERDIKIAKAGKGDLVYETLVGLKSDLSAPASVPKLLEKKYQKTYQTSDSSDYNDSDDTKSEDDEEDERKSKFVNSARPKNETTEEKKARKKEIKAEKAEVRKTKLKKHIKKRHLKQGKDK
ncbi:serine/threonine-protein kinase RIO1 [Trichogramma pretiosum]|uniref:serine/threonine-protein kinase RIO1 n=1 Tax=Trichogramma pretiosum TaxID=7493 RepID=UPI0006C975C3|nr:serine/threonine-protein kinase RIO1 [Trichogramma pretiosum]